MSDDENSFQWKLDDEEMLETAITVHFWQLTKTRTKLVFKPAGWFVKKLEKDVIATITPLQNPFPKVKDMTPQGMYALARVNNPKDHTKVFDCRALSHRAHFFSRANRGQLFGAVFCHLPVPRTIEGFS